MESRHFDFDIGDLREEQQSLDKLIDSLLNFSSSSSANVDLQKRRGNILSPVPVNKGRGRPPKSTNTAPASPSLVNRDQKPSLDTIIECLNKLNAQNKRLLDCVDVISENIKKKENASPEDSTQVLPQNTEQEVLANVNDRLEKIEQNINATTLVCSGPAITDMLKPSNEGESPNLERLKGEVCNAVCGENVTGIDVGNLQLSLFGRNRKCIRLQCANSTSKLHLLKQARERRPQGIYVNEFLTAAKLKILFSLRQLRKQHPEKIKSVFSRKGNILYTLQNSNQVHSATSVSELTNIFGSGSPETLHAS